MFPRKTIIVSSVIILACLLCFIQLGYDVTFSMRTFSPKPMFPRKTIIVSSVIILACLLYFIQLRYDVTFSMKTMFPRKTIIVSSVIILACLLYFIQLGYDVTSSMKTFSPKPVRWNATRIRSYRNKTRIRPSQLSKLARNVSEENFRRHLLQTNVTSDPFVTHRQRIESGQVIPEDLMKSGPFDILPNYRSPCWIYDKERFPPIKCLPYFYLAGVPKAGTTDLYFRIIQHPSISFLTTKEPHWINRNHYYAKSISRIRPTLNGYLSIFQNAIKDVYRNKEENGIHLKVFGDGSASTLWDNDYWELLPEFDHLYEPLYTNADYIHHLNPKTKIIAILRNPIDRLYSDYLFFQRSSKGPEIFHNSVVDIIDYTNACLENNTLRYCVYHRPPKAPNRIRLRIGIYYIHLKEYFRVFLRKQIYVIKLEEYSKDIAAGLTKVFDFLELEPVEPEKMAKMSKMDHKNTRRPKDQAIGEMLPKTRRLLEKFYRPFNKELVKLLGEKFNYNRAE